MKYIRAMKLPFRIPYADSDEFELLSSKAKENYDLNYGMDLHASWASDQAREFFNKMGYNIVGCEYFYFAPNAVMDIHIDGSQPCHKAKFNWAFGDGDHMFNFFEAKEQGTIDNFAQSGSKYSWGFREDQVELVDQAPIAQPSLCCVGVPHQVINGNRPLELFNICVWKKGLVRDDNDLGGMDMADGLEDFHEYLL